MSLVKVLGPVEIGSPEPLALGGPRQVALLAVLLVRRGEAVPVDALIDAVWDGVADAGAAKRVQVAVARLRRALEPVARRMRIESVATGYRLVVDAADVDAERFAAALDAGRAALDAGDPEAAATMLRDALAVWRGPAFAGVADHDAVRDEAAALDARRLTALEARIEADLRRGEASALVGELEGLVAAHPDREGAVAQLMRALYASGRQAEALDVFRRTRAYLVDEFGLEPGPELRRVQQRILESDPAIEAPRRKPRVERAPAAVEPLVARDADIDAVAGLLARPDVRLVTVVGPGGVGKTSLARALLASPRLRPFADGATFVDLSRLDDPDDIPVAIAEALGAPLPGGVPALERLAVILAAHERLLVLDNFEHLLPGAAQVDALLAACPRIVVLATSRAPLGLRAERRWPLGPLEPDSAIDLFAARATARDPSFRLDRDATAVSDICVRTGGLPLAIELAAARVSVLSPGQIADRMASGALDLPLDLSDAPARHRSLRSTLEWSRRLLSDAEGAAFDRFAVFVGGAAPEAAEAVTGASLAVLEGLVAQSMLVRRDGATGLARLVMLEPVREFAAEAGAADDIRARHAEHFADFAEAGRDGIRGRDWVLWRDLLTDDLGNLRAALQWAVAAGDRALALRMAIALRRFWDLRWLTPEGYEWLSRALAVPGSADPLLEARATLTLSAYALPGALTFTAAEATARRAAEMFRACGDPAGEAEALLVRGGLLAFWEREGEARSLIARARELIGDDVRLHVMAMHLEVMSADRFEEAEKVARAAVAEIHRSGIDLEHEGAILGHCGRAALFQLRHAEALSWLADAVDVARATDDAPRIALARGDQGCAALGIGDIALADAAFTEELEICRRLGYYELVPEGALGLAAVALDRGDRARAALLAGAALAAFERTAREPVAPLRWIVDTLLEPARRDAPEAWERAGERGAQLSEAEIVAVALGRSVAGAAELRSAPHRA